MVHRVERRELLSFEEISFQVRQMHSVDRLKLLVSEAHDLEVNVEIRPDGLAARAAAEWKAAQIP